jgi:hypothetical protein
MKKLLSICIVIILLVTPANASSQYANLELLDGSYGHYFTVAGGHYYGIRGVYDDMEEIWYYVLLKDGETVLYTFDDEWGPRGIVQVDGIIYVACIDRILKYSGGKVSVLTDDITGYVHAFTTNGNNLYVVCDDDSPANNYSCFEGSYYKVSLKGAVAEIKGSVDTISYNYKQFSVNSSGDRLARIAYVPDHTLDGVRVRRMDGVEYTQRVADGNDGDYPVCNVLYYNDCLLANVNGSIVYYDERNKPHVLLGDMKGGRCFIDPSAYQPPNSLPIESGSGDKVRIGYVSNWTIGSDGYIYGRAEIEAGQDMIDFKLSIPDYVKKTVTYKKIKTSTAR